MKKKFTQKVIKNDISLCKECFAEGEQEERAKGIVCYVHEHKAGIIIIYKNAEDSGKILREEVEFEMEGLLIEGNHPDDVKVFVEVKPGEEQIIRLTATEDEFGFGMDTQTKIIEINKKYVLKKLKTSLLDKFKSKNKSKEE